MSGNGGSSNSKNGNANSGNGWGTVHTPQGDLHAYTGGSGANASGGGSRGNAGDYSNKTNTAGTTVLKVGDSYTTPYGAVKINTQGHAELNGVVLTPDNSSLVAIGANNYTRVLNSLLIDKKPLNTGNYKNKTVTEKLLEEKMEIAQSLEAGIIPHPYIEENGKIGLMKPTYSRVSLGHAEHDIVFSGNKFLEDPILTDAYTATLNAIKFTSDFYQNVTNFYGENASSLAQSFAAQAKGKSIRNVDEALKAFDKYRDSLGKKFNVADRKAIAAALESRNYADMATSLNKYSRAFGYTGYFIDIVDVYNEFVKAVETDVWRPFFVKFETMTVSKLAVGVVAFVFSAMTGVTLGIIGYALLMAIIGVLIDDKLLNNINEVLSV